MKSVYFMLFIAFILVAGWFMRRREHMADKHPIYGPKGVVPKKNQGVYPEIYGPVKDGWGRQYQKVTHDGEDARYPDNGEFQSNTATQNAAYMNVFTYPAYMAPDFPSPDGPPEPYLNDFSRIHH